MGRLLSQSCFFPSGASPNAPPRRARTPGVLAWQLCRPPDRLISFGQQTAGLSGATPQLIHSRGAHEKKRRKEHGGNRRIRPSNRFLNMTLLGCAATPMLCLRPASMAQVLYHHAALFLKSFQGPWRAAGGLSTSRQSEYGQTSGSSLQVLTMYTTYERTVSFRFAGINGAACNYQRFASVAKQTGRGGRVLMATKKSGITALTCLHYMASCQGVEATNRACSQVGIRSCWHGTVVYLLRPILNLFACRANRRRTACRDRRGISCASQRLRQAVSRVTVCFSTRRGLRFAWYKTARCCHSSRRADHQRFNRA